MYVCSTVIIKKCPKSLSVYGNCSMRYESTTYFEVVDFAVMGAVIE